MLHLLFELLDFNPIPLWPLSFYFNMEYFFLNYLILYSSPIRKYACTRWQYINYKHKHSEWRPLLCLDSPVIGLPLLPWREISGSKPARYRWTRTTRPHHTRWKVTVLSTSRTGEPRSSTSRRCECTSFPWWSIKRWQSVIDGVQSEWCLTSGAM